MHALKNQMSDDADFDEIIQSTLSTLSSARSVQTGIVGPVPAVASARTDSSMSSSPSPRSNVRLNMSAVNSPSNNRMPLSPLSNFGSPLGSASSPSARHNSRARLESLMEDSLEQQRKLHSIELKVNRCLSKVDAQVNESVRLSREMSSTKQQSSQTALRYDNVLHQLKLFQQKSESAEKGVMQCVGRGEGDRIIGTRIKPLRSEIQVQLENVGRQFAIANRRMDQMSKQSNEISHRADAASARVSALTRASNVGNSSMVSFNGSMNDTSGMSLLGGGTNTSMNNSTNANANGSLLSEVSWNRIDNHLDASMTKCKREIIASFDERVRLLESTSGAVGGTQHKISPSLLLGASSSKNPAAALQQVQERVQQCYENVFKMGGQLAEEKERRQIAIHAIRGELREYVQDLLASEGVQARKEPGPLPAATAAAQPPRPPTSALAKQGAEANTVANLTSIARAAVSSEMKKVMRTLSNAMGEIEELKDEIATLKARLRKAEEQIGRGHGKVSPPPAAAAKKSRAQEVDRILAIRMGNKKTPPAASSSDSSDTDEEDPNLSDLPVVKWAWENVEAWLKHIKVSAPIINKFKLCDIVGVLLIEIELKDLEDDDDLHIPNKKERMLVWNSIQALKKSESRRMDSQFNETF